MKYNDLIRLLILCNEGENVLESIPEGVTKITEHKITVIGFLGFDIRIPKSVKTLYLHNNYENIIFLSNKIKNLYINIYNGYLIPKNVENITITGRYTYISYLPKGLKKLHILGTDITINCELPNSIKVLDIGNSVHFKEKIKNWPDKLKYLRLGNNYTDTLDNLPDTVEVLKILSEPENRGAFSGIISSVWGKDDIKTFDKPINTLPKNLQYLGLPKGYKKMNAKIPDNVIVKLDC